MQGRVALVLARDETGHCPTDIQRPFLAYLRAALTGEGRKASDPKLVLPPEMTLQQALNLLNRLGRESWHVRVEEAYAHAGAVLKYAGRYIPPGAALGAAYA